MLGIMHVSKRCEGLGREGLGILFIELVGWGSLRRSKIRFSTWTQGRIVHAQIAVQINDECPRHHTMVPGIALYAFVHQLWYYLGKTTLRDGWLRIHLAKTTSRLHNETPASFPQESLEND